MVTMTGTNNNNNNGNRNQGSNSNANGNTNNRNNRRFNSSKNNNSNRNNRKPSSSKDKSKNKIKKLEDIIFDANRYNQADEFIKAVEGIAEHVGINFENGGDVKRSIEQGVKMTIPKPVKPEVDEDGDMDDTDVYIWKKELDLYIKRKMILDTNLEKAYSLVWSLCSDVMQEKLQSLDVFKKIKESYDVLALIEQMKIITFKFEEQKYPFSSVYFANKKFYNYKQGAEDTPNEHYDKLNNLVNVVESYGGLIGNESILLDNDEEFSKLSKEEKKDQTNIDAAKARNKDRFLAFCYIAKADNNRYGDLKISLENDYAKGNNNYPTTIGKALRLLTNYRSDKVKNSNKKNDQTVSFAQKESNNNRNNGKYDDSWHKDATCHNCGKKGHIKPNCPDLDKNETTNNNNGTETEDNNSNNNNNSNNITNGNGNNNKRNNNRKGNQNLNIGSGYDSDTDSDCNFSFFMKSEKVISKEVW